MVFRMLLTLYTGESLYSQLELLILVSNTYLSSVNKYGPQNSRVDSRTNKAQRYPRNHQ